MENQRTAIEYGTEIRPYYPSISNASIRAIIDDLLEFADKKEREIERGIQLTARSGGTGSGDKDKKKKPSETGQLKPKPDGSGYDKIKEKFTEDVLDEIGSIDPVLRQLIEALLAYIDGLINTNN